MSTEDRSDSSDDGDPQIRGSERPARVQDRSTSLLALPLFPQVSSPHSFFMARESGDGYKRTTIHSTLRLSETAARITDFHRPPTRVIRTGILKREPIHHFSDVVSTVMQPTNEYEYSPIAENEIRLLLLQPGETDDTIECALITSGDQKIPYEALSYAWGPSLSNCEIRIRQVQGERSIKNFKRAKYFIRPNLHSALRHLRDSKSAVALWVDALCINQYDAEEMNAQMKKLPAIYNQASNVCIWLGEGTSSSAGAMEFLRQALDVSYFVSPIPERGTVDQLQSLVELIKRPWFSRLWVVQNMAVAREASMHCGNEVIHWADFADAITLLRSRFEDAKSPTRGEAQGSSEAGQFTSLGDVPKMYASVLVDTVQNLMRRSDDGSIIERTTSLETLVTTLSTFEASWPHDYIYALIPLAKPGPSLPDAINSGVQLPPIDYTKSVFEVFQDFVSFCIFSSHSLDIICRHWAPLSKSQSGSKLPSWIPSLTNSAFGPKNTFAAGRINGDNFVGHPGRQIYHAAGGTRPVVVFGTRSNPYDGSLSVKGFQLDKIASIGPRNAGGLISAENLRMAGWVPDHNGDFPSWVPDKLWRTLVADRGSNGVENPPTWYHRACLHCLSYSIATGDVNTTELIGKGSPVLTDFLGRVQSVVWNRKFLVTEAGNRLGLAPSRAKEGDLICILYGCSVPVVLREREAQQWQQSQLPQEQQQQHRLPFHIHNSNIRGDPLDRSHDRITASQSSSTPRPATIEMESSFELIGECYIHGMMEGEAFDDGIDAVGLLSKMFQLI